MAYYKCGKIFATQNSNTSIATASGPIASFNTQLSMPLLSCKCDFAASQASGTPTPAASIPIVGVDKVNITRTGKNLLSMKIYDGGSYNPAVGTQWNLTESTNEFTRNGNAYSITTSSTWRYFTVLMPLKSGIDYFMHIERASTGSDAVSYVYLDKDFKVLSVTNNTQTPYTTDSALNPPANTAYYALVFTNRSTANCTITITNPYIIVGSTATDFEPFNGTTAIINLGGTYYGGSDDAVTGKITLTHSHITNLGSNIKSCNKESNLWRVEYNSAITQTGNTYKMGICNMLAFKTSYANINTNNYSVGINSSIGLLFRNDDITTEQEAKDFLTTLDIVYPLATPLVAYASNTAEIPTIAGANNCFCDTGDITVTYRSTQEFYKVGSIYVTQNSNVVINTTSGSVANFNTSLAMPVLGCIAEFSASQASGTPTPAAPIPIVGVDKVNVTRTGKNLCGGSKLLANAQAYLPSGTTDLDNKTFRYATTTTATSGLSFTSGIKFKENTAYTFILSIIGTSGYSNLQVVYTDDTTANIPNPSASNTKEVIRFVSNANKTVKNLRRRTAGGSTIIYYEESGIFEGNISTADFEPYNGTTALINLGGTYYGGGVDALSREITKTVDVINDLSDRTWNATSLPHIFYATVNGKKAGYTSFLMCEQYSKYEGYFTGLGNNQISSNTTYPYIYIRNDDCDTPSDLVTALSGVKLAYELATPETAYASNTAELYTKARLNNIFCDTGDIEVKYRRISDDI